MTNCKGYFCGSSGMGKVTLTGGKLLDRKNTGKTGRVALSYLFHGDFFQESVVTASIVTAQTLASGIFEMGSRASLVSRFAAASL